MNAKRLPRPGKLWIALSLLVVIAGCGGSEPESAAIQLVDRFEEATIDNAVEAKTDLPRTEWRFDDESNPPEWKALDGLKDVAVRDGKLTGRTTGRATLILAGPEKPDPNDFLHAIEIKLAASEGTRLGVSFKSDDELDLEALVGELEESSYFDFNIDLIPGDESRTYTLTSANARFQTSFPISGAKHILIRPTDAEGADFEIESLRLITCAST